MTMTNKPPKTTASAPATIQLDADHVALVDSALYPFLRQYQWKAVKYFRCWYARLVSPINPSSCSVSMHRLIANTPAGMVCHHRNRNSLDNRRSNLLNLTREEHRFLHQNNTLKIVTDGSFPYIIRDASGGLHARPNSLGGP